MSSKKALVTGAGVRLGRAIALALAEAGYDVVLHAHRSGAARDDVARAVQALGRRTFTETADLSDPDAVDALGARIARDHPVLDAIVHNAGLFEQVAYEDITRAQYRRMMAVQIDAPFFLTQALLPSLRAAHDPVVVHITDVAATRPVTRYAHYSVSKAALEMLTRALATELGPRIRVNAVAPGTVMFPADFDEAARARILARIPLGREGTAEDVARAVRFLVVDGPYVSGQTLAVDGARGSHL